MSEDPNQSFGYYCHCWSRVPPLFPSITSLVPSWLGVTSVSSHQSGLKPIQSFLLHSLREEEIVVIFLWKF